MKWLAVLARQGADILPGVRRWCVPCDDGLVPNGEVGVNDVRGLVAAIGLRIGARKHPSQNSSPGTCYSCGRLGVGLHPGPGRQNMKIAPLEPYMLQIFGKRGCAVNACLHLFHNQSLSLSLLALE